jgi:hypothetical protein
LQSIECASLVVDNWKINESPNDQDAVSQLIQAAIDAGIARGAIADTHRLRARTRARPWIDSPEGRTRQRSCIVIA